MKIFDTLSEKQVEIEKNKKNINVFVCGLTVYDKSHIGHARTYLLFDALIKYIRSTGQKVFYLQNFFISTKNQCINVNIRFTYFA